MKEQKVQINKIIRNQLPEYVREDFPLISEFLSQYYLSQEVTGAPYDLIQNIEKYIKLDEISNLDNFEDPILLENISTVDTDIRIKLDSENRYDGQIDKFPTSYGLIQINDEILLYEKKIVTPQFVGFSNCARGFSGITELRNLTFNDSEAKSHLSGSKIINLSNLFLKAFLSKIKYQLSPGFENRDFYKGINENVLLKQIKDFYSSKGTEESFKILFKILYGEDVKIIKPKDNVFKSSASNFKITKNYVAEEISGNFQELDNTTLWQDNDYFYNKSYAPISEIENLYNSSKTLSNNLFSFKIDGGYNRDLPYDGATYGKFNIHPKTKVIGNILANSTIIDVDSTVGFPKFNGKLSVQYSDGSFGIIEYKEVNVNQFLGCSGITKDISDSTSISIDSYAYSKFNEETKVRITPVLSSVDIPDESFLLKENDLLEIKTLGNETTNPIIESLIHNIPLTYIVNDFILTSSTTDTFIYKISLDSSKGFSNDESIKLISSFSEEFEFIVLDIPNSKEINIKGLNNLLPSRSYKVKKQLNKADFSNYNDANLYNANVQNTYFDIKSPNDTLISSSSLPYFGNKQINLKSKEIIFPEASQNGQIEKFVGDTIKITNLSDHGLYTGDSIYYTPEKIVDSNGKEVIESELFNEGIYFVKRVDKNRIKLAKSRSDIYYSDRNPNKKSRYVTIQNETTISNNKIEKYSFYNKDLKSQKIFRKIYNQPITQVVGEETKPGNVGILVNGVEILNYKSKDSIYYGKLEKIDVIGNGEDYDIINPPVLEILDPDGDGNGAKGYCSVIGSLEEVRIIDPGFGYSEPPITNVIGGNGFGAMVSPNMQLIDHSASFDSSVGVTTSDSAIGFSTYHKLRTGEKVFYRSYSQIPVGGLTPDSSYFVRSIDPITIKLHENFSDSISGINTISLDSTGNGNHSFECDEKKLTISSITIIDSGSGYENKKRTVKSVGINTSLDFIEIRDHGFNYGEILKYNSENSPIGGLSNNSEYYVLPIDNDRFRLCGISTVNSERDFLLKTKQFIDLTSSGSGIHVFNYPPISLEILEKFLDSDKQYGCLLDPLFKGEISSVHLEDSGSKYGSRDIINFIRKPIIKVSSGEGALLTPIINNGRIVGVSIDSPGKNYSSSPNIIISGDGVGAILTPIVENGEIKEIKIISSGINYSKNNTRISIITNGSGAVFDSSIQRWVINEFSKRFSYISEDDGFIDDSLNNDLQYYNIYAPRYLRQSLFIKDNSNNNIYGKFDLEIVNNKETSRTIGHSPIIGWAYDGNPIYGPYGYKGKNGGDIVQLKSGYELRGGLDISEDRPPINQFPAGFFIEDYNYNESSDEDILDENNGRYCFTPEFPNGTYAYFSTFEEKVSTDGPFLSYKSPKFPYLIGKNYNNKVIEFNLSALSNQNNIDLENSDYIRNTYYYRFLKEGFEYDYVNLPNNLDQDLRVKNTSAGSLDEVSVINGGINYKVDDDIVFSNTSGKEFSASAKISRIQGKKINSASGVSTYLNDIEIYPSSEDGYVIYTKNPHNFNNLDNILIFDYDKKNDLSGKYQIKISPNILIISGIETGSLAIQSPSITGIVTYFTVNGKIDNTTIKANDVYQIGEEKIKVLSIDSKNSRIRVLRNFDSTTGSSYSVYSKLVELPRKFEISSKIKKDFEFNLNKELYFNPLESVGFGTSYGVGITSTIFLDYITDLSSVGFETGLFTTVKFENPRNFGKYRNQKYVDIVNSSNSNFNSEKVRVVSTETTSNTLKLELDTRSLSGLGVTGYLNIRNYIEIPTKSIYVPDHNLNTNDEIIYSTNDSQEKGIVVYFDNNVGISTTTLSSGQVLYVAKITDDLIGISTVRVSISTETNSFVGISSTNRQSTILSFVDAGIGSYHSFKTNYQKNSGEVSKNILSINTKEPHNLSVGDEVFVDLMLKDNFTFKIIYNDYLRSLLVNPIEFTSSNINIQNDSIFIPNHGFESGQKVVYSSNNEFYYIIVIDSNTISLSDTEYNSKKASPIAVSISEFSDGYLSPVNPPLSIYRDSKVTFDLSDPSLSYLDGNEYFSAFDFKLFADANFTNEYKSFNISRYGEVGLTPNASLVLQIDDSIDSIENELYYNLIPKIRKNIPIEKSQYLFDDTVSLNNKIDIRKSIYSGSKIVTGVSTYIFTYDSELKPEKSYYDNTNLSAIIKYDTSSKSAYGEIKNILVVNGGKYYSLPGISTIITQSGSLSVLECKSKTIGEVKKIKINDIGYDFPADSTLRPKVIFPQVLKINLLSILDSVKVVKNGIGYVSNPNLIVLDGITKKIEPGIDLQYDYINKDVKILSNFANLNSVTPKIIPINNSNGVGISSVGFNTVTKDVTVKLSVGFSTLSSFPFSVNDNILVENISVGINSIGRGYNSSDYDYTLFKVTAVSPNIGGIGSITYNLSELLGESETPGFFDPRLSPIGRVIPEKHFPEFEVTTKVLDYKVGETVDQDGIIGKVLGWDNKTNLLKVISRDKFFTNQRIKGITSKANGTINYIEYFSSFSRLGEFSLIENGWNDSIGFLNNNSQRIQDNFYYQNFSYSIKSRVDYETWKDAVNSLNHTLGYKNFSDYELESSFIPGNRVSFENVILSSSLSQDQLIGDQIIYLNNTSNIKSGDFITLDFNSKFEVVGVGVTYVEIKEKLSSNYIEGSLIDIERNTIGIGTGISVNNVNLQSNDSDLNNAEIPSFIRGTISPSSDSVLVSELVGIADLNTIYDFDRCLENSIEIKNDSFSDTIFLESRYLTDYFIAQGNRIILIDDISPQFNINPRVEKYALVNSENVNETQCQKYIIYVKDKRYYYDRQITLVDVAHNKKNVYINQYANLFTNNDLGSYDARIKDENCELLFYPNKFKVNDYEIVSVNYNLNDSLSSIGNTSLGNCIDIFTNTTNLTSGSTIVSVGNTYRSLKTIIQISNSDDLYQFDEIDLIYDGNDVFFSEFGQLVSDGSNYSSVGLGTYYPYVSGSNINIDFIPSTNEDLKVNTIQIGIKTESVSGISTVNLKNVRLESRSTSIGSSISPIENVIGEYPNQFDGAYFVVQVSDITNKNYKVSNVVVLDDYDEILELNQSYFVEFGDIDTSLSGIGTLGTKINDSVTQLTFTPNPNIEVEIKIYMNSFNYLDQDNIQRNFANIIRSDYQEYQGTFFDIKRSFDLTSNGIPIFERVFDGSNPNIVSLTENTIEIKNHFFVSGEKIQYSYEGDTASENAIGIGTTNFAGIGFTNKLPSTAYAIKYDSNKIKLASTPINALSGISLDIQNLGIGSYHKISSTNNDPKTLICIDNVIQSPLAFTSKKTNLSKEVFVTSDLIYLSDPSYIFTGDILKIDDEFILVEGVGIGSTNAIRVRRPWLGTVIDGHSNGSLVTKVSGSYTIKNNKINFVSAPVGRFLISTSTNPPDEQDWDGIYRNSSFQGRVFTRSGDIDSGKDTYADNYVFDDLSTEFNLQESIFELKSNGNDVSGISTYNSILLINNVLQIPGNSFGYILKEKVGITTIKFNGQSIENITDINTSSLPATGIIVSVGSSEGFGYQPLVSAGGTSVVSSSGTISKVYVNNQGSGYRNPSNFEVLTSTSQSIGAGATEIFLENENSIYQILNLIQDDCSIGVGTYIKQIPIVSVSSTSVFVDALEGVSQYDIPSGTKTRIDFNNPKVGIVNVGIITNNSVSSYDRDIVSHLGITTIVGGHISTSVSITNPGFGYTALYVKETTRLVRSVGSGSTEIFLESLDNIITGDYISIDGIFKDAAIVGVSSTSVYIGTSSTVSSTISLGQEVSIKYINEPKIIFEDPLSYTNIPLIYSGSSTGIGTQATVDIIVGQNSSIIDFEFKNLGYYYRDGDILTIPTGGLSDIPTSSSFVPFEITVTQVFNDRFSSWSVGNLVVLDDISNEFDGNKTSFNLVYEGSPISIVKSKSSTVSLENILLITINNIIQEPGKSYTFSGGSIITFVEPPKGGDNISIILYKGTGDKDIILTNVIETARVGDEFIIGNHTDQKFENIIFSQNPRSIQRLYSSTIVNTNPYYGIGKNTDINFKRSVNLKKQTKDILIDGKEISKSRLFYEPSINPVSNLISETMENGREIYVDSIRPFFNQKNESTTVLDFQNNIDIISNKLKRCGFATAVVSPEGYIINVNVIDSGEGYSKPPTVFVEEPLSGNNKSILKSQLSYGKITSIQILDTGSGYDPNNPPSILIESPITEMESNKKVSEYSGDDGNIVGISITTLSGESYYSVLTLDLLIPQYSNLRKTDLVGTAITISSLSVGDYFTIRNSNIDTGSTTSRLASISNDQKIIGITTEFIDSIYQVQTSNILRKNVSGIGLTYINRIETKVAGIGTIDFSSTQIKFDSTYYTFDNTNLTSLPEIPFIDGNYFGNYSWGKIILDLSLDNSYNPYILDGSKGISKSDFIRRTSPLKYLNYKT